MKHRADRLTITDQRHGDRSVLTVEGDLDLETYPTLIAAVTDCLLEGRDVALDLRAVSFLDGAGLRALCACSQRAAEHSRALSLESVSPIVDRVLELTGLRSLFSGPGSPRAP